MKIKQKSHGKQIKSYEKHKSYENHVTSCEKHIKSNENLIRSHEKNKIIRNKTHLKIK